MAGHRIKNQYHLHYLTITTVAWVDIFTRDIYRKIIMDSLSYCQKNKDLVVGSFVLMSNHLHLIVYAKENSEGLSNIIRDFKRHTAKQIIKEIKNGSESRKEWLLMVFKYHAKYNKRNQTYQFWQQDNHPIELVSPNWINQKIRYIHLNPVRNGLVEKAEYYRYSSAANYVNKQGILEVEVIDLGLSIGYIAS